MNNKRYNPKVCFTAEDYRRFEEESFESMTTIVVSEDWARKHKSALERFKGKLSGGKDFKFKSGEREDHLGGNDRDKRAKRQTIH